jgi:hypothetical protein
MRCTLILLTVSSITFGQTDTQIDSLINVMCTSLESTKETGDTTKLLQVYGEHLFPFVQQFEETERAGITQDIVFRFQKDCQGFSDLLARLEPTNEHWKKVTEKPKSQVTTKECVDFLRHKKYTYIDSTGDTVRVIADKALWIDNFKDGISSKYKLWWVTDCEFELEFVETNNSMRAQYSKKGDSFVYQIVDKMENYFVLAVQMTGTKGYYIFHLKF